MKAIWVVYEIEEEVICTENDCKCKTFLNEYDSHGEEIDALRHIDDLMHQDEYKNKKFTILTVYES